MYFKYRDINLFYEKYGSGKEELVILPGWGNTRSSWDYIISLLADYYTIYIIDYPGFGNTNFPNRDLTIYDYATLIYEWLVSLNLNNPVLLGHSFGGRILTLLNGYYGYSYTRMIFIASAGIKPKKTFRVKFRNAIYKCLMKLTNLFPSRLRENAKKKIFNFFSSDDYKMLPTNMRKTFKNIVSEDLKDYLVNIGGSILLIWGSKDTSTPVGDGYFMNNIIKNSKMYLFEKGGHFVYLEYPIKITELIAQFVEGEI